MASPRVLTKLSLFQFLWHIRALTLAAYALELQMALGLLLPGPSRKFSSLRTQGSVTAPEAPYTHILLLHFDQISWHPCYSNTISHLWWHSLNCELFFLSFSIDFAVLKVNYSLASRLWLSRSLIGGFNRLGLLLAPGISFWRSMIPLIQLQCPHPTRISQLLAIVWVFSSSYMWFYHVGVSLSSTTVLIP